MSYSDLNIIREAARKLQFPNILREGSLPPGTHNACNVSDTGEDEADPVHTLAGSLHARGDVCPVGYCLFGLGLRLLRSLLVSVGVTGVCVWEMVLMLLIDASGQDRECRK